MISTRGDFMKRVLAAAFLIAIGAVSALAAGYDDFSRGVNATNRGDADAAISSFTAALAAGDLAAAYVPNAHLGRARAYLQKDKCAEALSDLNETIKLKTDNVEAYLLRANANVCLKNADASLADFKVAVDSRPSAAIYEGFARVQWIYGFFPQAADNFTRAFKLSDRHNTHRPYLVI
jgi:tetratricopeptide (TPR) repeat protein